MVASISKSPPKVLITLLNVAKIVFNLQQRVVHIKQNPNVMGFAMSIVREFGGWHGTCLGY
jgi:hypothetical protein